MPSCLDASLAALLLAASSGLPGLFLDRRSERGQAIATFLSLAAALLGLAAALGALAGARVETTGIRGALPELSLQLRLDPLSAFFLVPVYVLGAAGTLYGTRHWRQAEHPESARGLRLWFGVLIASLAGVVLAADGVAFLIAWELTAISAFLLMITEDEQPEVRQAGWVYLVSAHVGVLALIALFGLLWAASGSLALRELPQGALGSGGVSAVFLLALVAFGLKAGTVPLHFWLPAAHASAPSHVSALLSGVVLKLGIYGLLRIATLLPPPPPAVGLVLLAVGAGSAVYGVLFALGQHDLKRLLAYHSVENIGIIVAGLGLALIGISAKQPGWAVLGLAGCLLHVWNHALFKSLLFLAAGSVIHGTGTRELDRLGGLAGTMGRTAGLFALGAVAICGLPPLNGFVSELLIFLGLFRVAADRLPGAWSVAALAAPALALAGALALACFVKVFGSVFLGPARSEQAGGAHESPSRMLLAMALLALGCLAIGVLPVLVIPLLDPVIRSWMRLDLSGSSLAELVSWSSLMAANGLLIVGLGGALLLLRRRLRSRRAPLTVTWDCGYSRPGPSMAYTASSFAQILVRLHGWLLRPRAEGVVSREIFPAPTSFHTSVPEQVLDEILTPLWAGLRRRLVPLRVLQQGRIQQYLVYILLTLCVLLVSLLPIDRIATRFLGW
jgi:hydrogenase-4 component B